MTTFLKFLLGGGALCCFLLTALGSASLLAAGAGCLGGWLYLTLLDASRRD
jgi:hypothetical protein